MVAYWMVRVIVTDEDAYVGNYAPLAAAAVEKYGGRFLARGGAAETVEGKHCPRNVIVEWPSFEKAKEAYESPEYQEALQYALTASERDFCIVEGV